MYVGVTLTIDTISSEISRRIFDEAPQRLDAIVF